MTTTTDTQLEVCAACGAGFSTLSEVFSHPCASLKISRGRSTTEAPFARPQGAGTGSGVPTSSGPTDKQVAFIARLAADRGVEAPAVATKAQASAAIERLLAQPVARTASPTSVRANRYAGSCSHCRATVAEDEGRIEKRDGRWVTFHLDGACPEAAPKVKAPDVPSGRYAFTADEGHTAFAKVDHGKGQWTGRTFVVLLVGSPGHLREQRISHKASAAILAKITESGPMEAMARFGHELGVCGRCSSPLTDPESIARGIGPTCATKV
jgi:hypothetical protein